MNKRINWQRANFGVAVGKITHRHDPKLKVMTDNIHRTTSILSMNYHEMGNERLGGSEVCIQSLSALYDNTKLEWERTQP